MNRNVAVSLLTGGLVFCVSSGLSLLAGWPAAWFGVVAGVLIAIGLFVGLRIGSRPAAASGAARVLFLLLGLLMGALGLWAWVQPAAQQAAYVPWVALVCAVSYLASAAFLWSR